jgi:MFS family permease
VAIIPTSALWLTSSSFSYLFAVQVLSGAAWAAYELAMFLLAFETIPDQRRMAVMTAFNLANATAILVGSLLGGTLLLLGGITQRAYLTLFLISSIARVFAILLLLRAPGLSIRARWIAVYARLRLRLAAAEAVGHFAAAGRLLAIALGRTGGRTTARGTSSALLRGPHWQPRRIVVIRDPTDRTADHEEPAVPLTGVAAREDF